MNKRYAKVFLKTFNKNEKQIILKDLKIKKKRRSEAQRM